MGDEANLVTPADRPDSTSDGQVIAEVRDLRLTLERGRQQVHALRGVDLEIGVREVVALVGESGSGKSVLALSLLGLLPLEVTLSRSGEVCVAGVDMLGDAVDEQRALRGESLGAVFQDPMSSLDPTMRIGRQVEEVAGSEEATLKLLEAVGIPEARRRMRAFPHELSGGLRQRVMIAMALAGNPRLVIADEPTTALDATVQAQILRLIGSLRDQFDCAFLLITHDLAVAAEVADRIVVLYAGRVMEVGSARDIFLRAQHPYTAALLRSRFDLDTDRGRPLPTIRGEPPQSVGQVPPGCPFSTRCEFARPRCDAGVPDVVAHGPTSHACIRAGEIEPHGAAAETAAWDVGRSEHATASAARIESVELTIRSGLRKKQEAQILRGVDLTIADGEAVALVGESGCGKTTLLRTVAGLERPTGGTVELTGEAQIVFQDPASSLTPWLSIGEQLEDRLRGREANRARRRQVAADALQMVGLPRSVLDVHPRQLSGGQKQRVAIARAIVRPPALLLCDEPTSALDVSVAASVLNLLGSLRRELRMSLLFVTHDLAAARLVADRVAVMYLGRIVEIGSAEEILERPEHPYTQLLISAVPGRGPDVASTTSGEPASIYSPPSGCSFHPRCQVAQPTCPTRRPNLVSVADDHLADCVLVEE